MKIAINVSLILLVLIFNSCKKNEKSEDPITPISNPVSHTPAYVTPQPGALKTNITEIKLHPSDNLTVIAQLFNADGTISLTIPSLIWQTSDNAIASVSNGFITANAPGFANISVTDGIHGLQNINVTVVASTVVISNTPHQVSWGFVADVVAMKTNTSQAISNYTVYNEQGTPVSTSLTFIPPAGSGLNFSGNTIISGSVTGSYEVLVKSGNDTLSNALKVLVVSDTTYAIDIVSGSLPRVFHQKNISANRPVLLNVTKAWFVGSTPTFSMYVASPESILFVSDEFTINGSGYITSVNIDHGMLGCLTRFYYKNAVVDRYLFHHANFSGSWSGVFGNENYTFCLTQYGPLIYYNSNQYFINSNNQGLSGTYLKKVNNVVVNNLNNQGINGQARHHKSTSCLTVVTNDGVWPGPYSFYFINETTLTGIDVPTQFVKGNFSCVGTTTTTTGNLELILKGSGSTSWKCSNLSSWPMPCTTIPAENNFTFFANNTFQTPTYDGTCSFLSYDTHTWSVISDNGTSGVISSSNGTFNVTNYTSTQITLSGFTYIKQ
ncbi:MAG: hypothetical protein KA163_10805 [Bacteroidia bacterium]|nr:hypothetical protein [Bacteroidia bacterium]